MEQTGLKSNYAVHSRHEAFFTGGRVQFSVDGEYMFCGCGNRVNVIHVGDSKLLQSIGQEEDSEISSFVLSPDDQHLIVANGQLLLIQYDWKSNVAKRKWKAIHTTPVNCMAFDVTSTLLATGGFDHTIKVWDIVKQYCTHNLKGHTGVVSAVIFHPDLELLQLFSAADDYKIRQWDLRKSECLHVYSGHCSSISTLKITSNAETLVSSGRDRVVLCWNLSDKSKKTIPVFESVESLLVLDSKKAYPHFNLAETEDLHVITAGEKGALKVWNTRTGRCLFTVSITGSESERDDVTEEMETDSTKNHISQTMFVPRLDALCVVTYEHNIILYRMADTTILKQFCGYNDDILDVRLFGPDDRRLAVATNAQQLKIFDVDTWHCDIVYGHTDIVMTVDVYKNGQIMVTGSKDKTVRIWKLTDNDIWCLAVGTGHSKAVNTVAISRSRPDFCVSAGEDHTLKLWQVADAVGVKSDRELRQITAHLTERAHDKDINAVAVAPNDRFVVTGSQDKTAKLWKAEDLSLLGVFRGHKRGIWSVAFSPVDQAIVTASADCLIKIWSITDFTCVKTFDGHESSVLKVAFVARGMQVVSTDSDGLVKLWMIRTNECVKTFNEHSGKAWALCVSKDESRLVTGGADSNLFVWKDVTEEECQLERQKQEKFIVKEQKLMNLLQKEKHVKAIALAITLDQPFRLFNIIQSVLSTDNGEDELRNVILKLRPDQLGSVLRFAADWNTNSKYCHEAQTILNIVLKAYTLEQILQDIPDIKSTVEGFLPYTERHFQRLSRLKEQTHFVDYMMQCIKLTSILGQSHGINEAMAMMSLQPFVSDTIGDLGEDQVLKDDDTESVKEDVTMVDADDVESDEDESVDDDDDEDAFESASDDSETKFFTTANETVENRKKSK